MSRGEEGLRLEWCYLTNNQPGRVSRKTMVLVAENGTTVARRGWLDIACC